MIGGNDMTKTDTSYISSLSSIRDTISNHVLDAHGVYFDDVELLEELSISLYLDMVRIIQDEKYIVHSKHNSYSMTFFTKNYKAKVQMGTPKKIGEHNIKKALEYFGETQYMKDNFLTNFSSEDFHIEVYKMVNTATVDDCLRNDIDELSPVANNIASLVHEHDIEWLLGHYANYLYKDILENDGYRKSIIPNDMNTGNFLVTSDDEHDIIFNNIDYDHIISCNTKLAVHNAAWQFIGRMFDIYSISDELASESLLEYRKNNNLLDAVEKFKSQVYEVVKIKYDTDKDRFEYDVSLSTLNNNEQLYKEYLEAKEKHV